MQNIVTYVLGLQSGQFESGLARANGLTNNLTSSINGLGAAIGVSFGIAGIAMFTKSMIDAGSKVEDAQTGLTTLLGDAAEARKVINNTLEDAKKTPFAFEGLLAANKALISADETAKGARTAVLNLANAIAATGGGDNELQRMVVNLQQVKNVGFASALDIKQFAYAGINIYKVLTEAGIKAGEGSKITYQQITYALQKAHDEAGIYHNGLENMAENTSTKISNLGDAYFQLKVTFFENLKPMIVDFVNGFTRATEFVKEHADGIIALTKGLIAGALAFKAIAIGSVIINALKVAFIGLPPAIATTTVGLEGMAVASSFALGPIGLLIVGVTALAVAFSSLESAEESQAKKHQALKESAVTDEEEMLAYVEKKNSGKPGWSKALMYKNEKANLQQNLAENRKEWEKYNLDLTREQEAAEGSDEYYSPNTELTKKLKDLSDKGDILQSRIATVDRLSAPPKSAPITALTNKAKTANTGAPKFDKAQGQKSITINVSIKDLIGTYNSTVTNVQGNATKIKEAVLGALTGAVNDFQIVAGQ
jgi:endonuclease IV